ncbi:MAG TPA: tetratricopeptide repeat protein [Myxococcales bacterium]|nr:tetratricopeptide repeat protein [Myxococcales bacterium]
MTKRDWLAAAALLAAVLLVYQPAWHGGLLWDDAAHVTRLELRSWHGLFRIWFEPGATQQYYPLVHSAFWVQHRLWGDDPTGYHFVNLLLHAGAAAVAGLALQRLRVPGAWLAAALFALHPVQVESVAWITELKNTLSAVLYLGAALVWFRFEETRRTRFWLLALGLFLLALCSKTVTATLPAALLLVHWWRRGRPSWRRDVMPLLPFFVLAAAAGLFTIWVERRLVGAEGAGFDLSAAQRVLIAGRAPWFYLGKLVWPSNLVFIYPRWNVDPASLAQFLYPVAALGAFAGLWAQRKRFPGALAAALFFVGTLFPALGFFDVYPFLFSFVADHFQYLASLGILALAAAGLASLPWPRAARALPVALLAVLAALTWKQSRLYADPETLYRATLRGNPACWMAYSNLSGLLLSRGAAREAESLARKALELRPDYPEAHNNLGLALSRQGQVDEAIAHYRKAVELNPGYAEALNNLGFALAARGNLDEAIHEYRESLQSDPDRAGTHYNFAMALIPRGQLQLALAHLRQAVQLQPDFVEARNNLGILLARAGQLDEAIDQFRQALALAPGSPDVRRNLELALARRAAGSGGVPGHRLSGEEGSGAPRDEANGRAGDQQSGDPAR